MRLRWACVLAPGSVDGSLQVTEGRVMWYHVMKELSLTLPRDLKYATRYSSVHCVFLFCSQAPDIFVYLSTKGGVRALLVFFG